MSLKESQDEFNELCADYSIDDPAVIEAYRDRTVALLETSNQVRNWKKLAKRYYDLKMRALNDGNITEAQFYEAKYQDAMRKV
jgi:hypothetical protein